ncbi:MAG TPA: asparagine synthase (glutamine-hydrolyzing) [Nitrospira sp.]|nr:asparagine synthase (glutamine-hydrolyzing) [Nitrospira sp.]
MCGIAGYCSFEAGDLLGKEIQQKILDLMKTRGPDGSGVWTDAGDRVTLLHRRLAIQDLSETGAQPMLSDDGRLAITFNGEIYNVAELRRWVPDYPFKGTSDTEVLLAIYQKFGQQMLKYLRGMYAFAIWDDRNQGLFLARDAYGIKPLYLATTPHGLWFCSQVKPLLEVPGVDLSPEPAAHAGFFLWGSVPEPYTLYRGIRSLRSGHSLWLQRGGEPKDIQFASIAELMAQSAPLSPGQSESERLQDALRESVRAHFVADTPVAVFLSAGLDSSTILGVAAGSFCPANLNCLTLGFDAFQNTGCDERAEATHIASHYGVPQHIQVVTQADFEAQSTHFLEAMDQPTIDGINTYFVARMARDAGFKVALSGIGGDELFGGYGSFRQIPQMMNLARAMGGSRRAGRFFREHTEPLFQRVTSPKYAGVLEYGRRIEGAYLLRRSLFMPWELSKVLDADLADAGLAELERAECEDAELEKLKGLPLHLQISFLESTRYMRNQLLRDADWAGMAHSLEIRTPLVDQFLLKQLSPLLSSKHPPTKLEMAATPNKPLPQSVLHRKKTGFSVPVREWLTSSLADKPERGLRSWAKFVYRHQYPKAS